MVRARPEPGSRCAGEPFTPDYPSLVHVEPMNFACGPLELLAAWPANEPGGSPRPVAALISDARVRPGPPNDTPDPADRWSRWSLLAPIDPRRVRAAGPSDVGPTASGPDLRREFAERVVRSAFEDDLGPKAHARPDQARRCASAPDALPRPPFRLIVLAYELGRLLEPSDDPRAIGRARSAPNAGERGRPVAGRFRTDTPLAVAIDLPAALLFDRIESRWWLAGASEADAAALRGLVAHLPERSGASDDPFRLGPARSAAGRVAYTGSVAAALDLVRAGDVFQVNLSHELRCSLRGDRRAFFAALCRKARPWFGAYVELPSPWATIASVSPELFLDFDARTRQVVTRPIKGTRRTASAADAADLRASAKDSAELNMIVDLLRNDLGRVCVFGSIRVDEPRTIEPHAVLHAVATVSGRLREGLTLADLMLATFPGGSITGAPKVRAMQIIESLERSPRGAYCGTVALRSGDGSMTSSIAIRTATIAAGAQGENTFEVSFPVGAGIVADSDPESEWSETLDKAGVLLSLTTLDGEQRVEVATDDPITIAPREASVPSGPAASAAAAIGGSPRRRPGGDQYHQLPPPLPPPP